MKSFYPLFGIFVIFYSPILCASETGSLILKKLRTIEDKVQLLEEDMARMESDVAIVKSQSRLLIQKTTLGYLDASYIKAGLSILLPQQRSFNFPTDTGLGATIGFGQYVGRQLVFEGSLDWDIYLGASLRARWEFHSENPQLSIAPIIGFKGKIAAKPFDRFLNQPNDVKTFFPMAGFLIGFPVGRARVNTEVAALVNTQIILTATVTANFYFNL